MQACKTARIGDPFSNLTREYTLKQSHFSIKNPKNGSAFLFSAEIKAAAFCSEDKYAARQDLTVGQHYFICCHALKNVGFLISSVMTVFIFHHEVFPTGYCIKIMDLL